MNRSAAVLFAVLLAAAMTSTGGAASHDWRSYFQVRYTQPEDAGGYVGLRRLKLYGQGPVTEGCTYFAQFLYKANNRSPTDGLFVQEANVWAAAGRGRMTFGQFKPPFGMERFTSDWKLALIDRSQPTDRLIPDGSVGDSFARDRGLQWEGAVGPSLNLAVGVFDGNGANEPFLGNGPLLVTRAAYERRRGANGRLRAELALSWRQDHDIDFRGQLPGAPAGYSSFAGHDIRQNLAVACDAGPNSLRAEYLAAQYESGKEGVPSVDASGYYLQYARAVSDRWAAAARYERFDPNQSVTSSRDLSWLTLGATWYIRGDFEKVQVNYVFKSERVNEFDNDALLVQYQRFF